MANEASTKKTLDKSRYPQKPFEKIALALSGGGFRSAGYSLGVLSYLDHLQPDEDSSTPLLHHVKYLSTTSGGTITGAYYAYANDKGTDFNTFYRELFNFLNGEDLLDKVLNILKDDREWKDTYKRRNLINSFAKAYDSNLLFNGARFGELWNSRKTHIEEVCFNATEFFTGMSFRFQRDGILTATPLKPIGNEVIAVEYSKESVEVIQKIKLADILAASSCFPAGFEPIIYPHDFADKQVEIMELKEALNIDGQSDDPAERNFVQKKEFGLMDGGITDNQGLKSLIDADQLKPDDERFDLIIVNDVASHYMLHYTVPTAIKTSWLNRITPARLITGVKLTVLLFAISVLANITYSVVMQQQWVYLLIIVPQLMILTALFVIYFFIKKKLSFTGKTGAQAEEAGEIEGSLYRAENFTKKTVDKLFDYLKRVDIATISQMLFSRLNSVLTLNNDVFLKHIRRLIYDKFYESHAWDYRRIANHIYELSYTNVKNRTTRMLERKKAEDQLLSDENFRMMDINDDIKRIAQNAFKTPTTLWFDDKGRNNYIKESLIACGSFTTCHNLMKYIMRLENEKEAYNKLDEKMQKRIQYLKKQVCADWEKFLDDPFWLFNAMNNGHQGTITMEASMIENPQ